PAGPQGGGPVQAQPLPSLTPPDPAFAPPSAPAAPAPPAPAPNVVTPSTPAVPMPAPPPASVPATPIPGDWQARGMADLIALDKVTARTTPLSVKVGASVPLGSLTVTVRGCAVRGSDQPADATAFLEVTDRGAAAPVFRGWMFAAEPSLSV